MASPKKNSSSQSASFLLFVISLSIFLSSLFYLSYAIAKPDTGVIVLPGGKTYLGEER